MSNLDDNHSGGTDLQEDLVAYLDGELDATSSRRVEELIARNPDMRRELTALERSWELLDALPPAEVGEEFTHTTVEMIAVTAASEAERAAAGWPRVLRRIGLLFALLLACGAGFAVSAWLRPNGDEQLLRDLPLLEREQFDDYRQVGSIEFLRGLYESGLFGEEENGRDP